MRVKQNKNKTKQPQIKALEMQKSWLFLELNETKNLTVIQLK